MRSAWQPGFILMPGGIKAESRLKRDKSAISSISFFKEATSWNVSWVFETAALDTDSRILELVPGPKEHIQCGCQRRVDQQCLSNWELSPNFHPQFPLSRQLCGSTNPQVIADAMCCTRWEVKTMAATLDP